MDEKEAKALMASLDAKEIEAAKLKGISGNFVKASNALKDASRFLISLIVILAFAWVAIRVVGIASFDAVDPGKLPPPPTDPEALAEYVALREQFVKQTQAITAASMEPLNYLEDFLSSFILPVVTLIIGFYFGKEIAEEKNKDRPGS